MEVKRDVASQLSPDILVIFNTEMPPLPHRPTEGKFIGVTVLDATFEQSDPRSALLAPLHDKVATEVTKMGHSFVQNVREFLGAVWVSLGYAAVHEG